MTILKHKKFWKNIKLITHNFSKTLHIFLKRRTNNIPFWNFIAYWNTMFFVII